MVYTLVILDDITKFILWDWMTLLSLLQGTECHYWVHTLVLDGLYPGVLDAITQFILCMVVDGSN